MDDATEWAELGARFATHGLTNEVVRQAYALLRKPAMDGPHEVGGRRARWVVLGAIGNALDDSEGGRVTLLWRALSHARWTHSTKTNQGQEHE